MFELKPKYIDFYNVGRAATFSFVLSIALIICMNIGISIIYDSRSSHPTTTNEMIDYVMVVVISALSYIFAAFLVLRMRDLLADSFGPFIPIFVVGFVAFLVLFTFYSFAIGLNNDKIRWFDL